MADNLAIRIKEEWSDEDEGENEETITVACDPLEIYEAHVSHHEGESTGIQHEQIHSGTADPRQVHPDHNDMVMEVRDVIVDTDHGMADNLAIRIKEEWTDEDEGENEETITVACDPLQIYEEKVSHIAGESTGIQHEQIHSSTADPRQVHPDHNVVMEQRDVIVETDHGMTDNLAIRIKEEWTDEDEGENKETLTVACDPLQIYEENVSHIAGESTGIQQIHSGTADPQPVHPDHNVVMMEVRDVIVDTDHGSDVEVKVEEEKMDCTTTPDNHGKSELRIVEVGITGNVACGQIKVEPYDWSGMTHTSSANMEPVPAEEDDPLAHDDDNHSPGDLPPTKIPLTDNLYSCSDCGHNFPKLYEYKRHVQIHLGEKPFICHHCGHATNRKDNLRDHIRLHQAKPHLCNVCHKKFSRKECLRNHSRIHTGEKPYVCNTCGHRTCWKRTLKKHVKTHDKPTYGKYACDKCINVYYHITDLEKHIEKAHTITENDSYICFVCHTEFKYKSELILHEYRAHSRERPLNCNMCEGTFSSNKSLYMHKRVYHRAEESLAFDPCEESLAFDPRESTDKNKTYGHPKPKRFACKQCDETFDSQDQLRRHKRSAHTVGNPYSCELCDYTCRTRNFLEFHMSRHTGTYSHQCELCKHNFKTPSRLKRHMKNCKWVDFFQDALA